MKFMIFFVIVDYTAEIKKKNVYTALTSKIIMYIRIR